MKKISVILSLLLVLGILLAGAALADDPFTLHYMTGSNGDLWKAEQQIISNFEAANPNVKVETTVVTGTADFVTALKAKFAAGEEPDMFNFQGGNRTVEFARAGKLYDMTDEAFMENAYPADLELTTYQGRVYAFPLDYQCNGLWINLDALAKYGDFEAPRSFPELIELCAQLREKGLEYPLLCAGKDINNVSQVDFQYLCTVVWFNNPDYYLEILKGERTFKDEWIREMFNKYEQMREYMSADTLGVDNDEAIKRFIRGDGVLWIAHGNTITRLREMDPELNCIMVPSVLQDNVEDRVFNIGVCNSMHIVNTTESLEDCVKFMEHYLSQESSELRVTVGKTFSTVKGITVAPDPAFEPCLEWIAGERRIGHTDLFWIAGIKDVMKEVTQKWFLGDPLDDVLNEWESQHQKLMAADPAYVEEYISTYGK